MSIGQVLDLVLYLDRSDLSNLLAVSDWGGS